MLYKPFSALGAEDGLAEPAATECGRSTLSGCAEVPGFKFSSREVGGITALNRM